MYLLSNLLTETTEKFPDKDAIVFGGESVTYEELEKRSNQLAFALLQMGIKKGDRVGILLKKSIESIISLFGIMKAGAIYVPIDPLAPDIRSRYIIRNCGIDCVVSSAQGMSQLINDQEDNLYIRKLIIVDPNNMKSIHLRHNIQCIAWKDIYERKPIDYHNLSMADVNPAYILHTSGSTGIPKGVVISHLNALTFVNMAADFFDICSDDRIASHAPLHFDLSVFDIFCAVKKGATIHLVPEFLSTFPVKLTEFIASEGITVWNSVSSVLTMLAERGRLERFDFDVLRLIHFSGDIMPVKYLRVLKKHMKRAAFFNIYGQTEANSSMFFKVEDIPGDMAWKIPIGKPFPNFDVFAMNANNEAIVHPGEEGELLVKSSTVALGYWGDIEKTLDKFIQEPRSSSFRSTVYRTGDIVQIDKDGNYLFTGRKDLMVKSRGYRIELSEIELALTSHPSVSQTVVIAMPDELIGNRIIAYSTIVDGENIDAPDLLDHCGRLLPKYMVPEAIEIVKELPKTSTGKVDRKYCENDAIQKYSSAMV